MNEDLLTVVDQRTALIEQLAEADPEALLWAFRMIATALDGALARVIIHQLEQGHTPLPLSPDQKAGDRLAAEVLRFELAYDEHMRQRLASFTGADV